MLRQDIKAAQKAGTIPETVKLSVRTSRHAGGSAINVTVMFAPRAYFNPEYMNPALRNVFPQQSAYTEVGRALLDTLTELGKAYQSTESNSMADRYNRNFHLGVDYDWKLMAAVQAEHAKRFLA